MRKYDLIRHMEKVHAISYNCKNGKINRQQSEDSLINRDSKEVDEFFRENKEIVRKRRPINFSLNDLDDDETGDDTWNATPKGTKNGFTSPPMVNSASIGSGAQKTRMLPRRSAASKIKFDEDAADEETDEDDIFDPNPTPAMKKQANSGVEKVFIVLFKFCSKVFSFEKLFSILIGWFGFLKFLVWGVGRPWE